jgi:SAM-dependent methyltransferase
MRDKTTLHYKKHQSLMKKNTEKKQLSKPYQSTIQFEKFLIDNIIFKKNIKKILDIGCGIGANIKHFSKKFPDINFTGWDYSKSQISTAKKINKNPRVTFNLQDIYKIKKKKYDYDLVFSVHTFCVFKSIESPIKNLAKMSPKWIAINSLFYDGPLDVLIHIRDLENDKIKDDNPDADFNIHSLSNSINIFKRYGYKVVKIKKFYPSSKLKKKSNGRGSYTAKTEFNKNTVFTGPVHLPWYFILAKKINDKK